MNKNLLKSLLIVTILIILVGFFVNRKNLSRLPKDIDGVDLVVSGIRESVNPYFQNHTIDQLFKDYSIPKENLVRSYLIFFDYYNDGKMDFVTAYTGDNLMMYVASSTSVIEKKPSNYLNDEVFRNGGKIYYRELDWEKILQDVSIFNTSKTSDSKWKNYKNNEQGFSVDVPANFTISIDHTNYKNEKGNITTWFEDPKNTLSRIMISEDIGGNFLPINQGMLDTLKATAELNHDVGSSSLVLIGGEESARFDYDPNSKTHPISNGHKVFIIHNGNSFTVEVKPYRPDLMERIQNSFTFTK